MKKAQVRRIIVSGIACILLMAVSAWYSITFNDSRLVKPMDASEYSFQIRDLPMLISTILLILYGVYLVFLLVRAILDEKSRETQMQTTRRINPKYGFFGFFGLFYEGKLSGTFMDERFRENQMKAHMKANQTAVKIIFLATLVLGQGKLIGNLEYTLIAFVIIVALSLALEVFLGEYLLYRYDHDDRIEESEE
ncbi:MAG: DUF3796 domain-containing protein [Dorea sp.]|nr:DUF3796 domain-containing protein [Dorea sp.]